MADIRGIKTGTKPEKITRTLTTCDCGARFFELETIDQHPDLSVMTCMHCAKEYLVILQDIDAPIPS